MDEQDLIEHLVAEHAACVVILYGSAARGELTPESDIDVVCFREGPDRYPLSYHWRGLLVDAWIHPLSDAAGDARDFSKLDGGRVLLDSEARGQELLDRVNDELGRPPEALAPREERHRRAWVWKMFDRARRGGPEGDYRRHWLLYDLPETWCDLTRRRYFGPIAR
jgi:hypothetical protein